MVFMYIIFILLVLAIIIVSFVLMASNDYNEFNVRLDRAQVYIDKLLKKRIEYLNKGNELVKNELNLTDNPIKKLDSINSTDLNSIELDKKIYSVIEEFYELSEEYIDLKDNTDYIKIESDIIKSESDIVALKEYYNDTAKKCNVMINKIPYNVVAKVKKFKEKTLYELEDHSKLINNLKER